MFKKKTCYKYNTSSIIYILIVFIQNFPEGIETKNYHSNFMPLQKWIFPLGGVL